jgi:hypothetical protein
MAARDAFRIVSIFVVSTAMYTVGASYSDTSPAPSLTPKG